MMSKHWTRTAADSGRAGFTLIELLIATAVFAVGMVGVLGSLTAVMNNQRVANIKRQSFLELENQSVALQGDILGAGAGVFTFDVNNPNAIELAGFPGSSLTLYIVRPDDPDTIADESEIFELPMTADPVAEFPDGVPDPLEIVFEGLVPANTANNTFYRFRMSGLF